MAQFNADILLNVVAKNVERELNKIESRLNKLSNAGQDFTEAFVAPRALKQIDRELATIAGRADTAAKRFARVVEGAGTLGVAAKGAADIGQYLKELSVSAQNAQDSLASIPQAIKSIIPGLQPAVDITDLLSKTIGTAEYKFNSLAGAAENVLTGMNAVGGAIPAVTATVAALAAIIEGQLSEALYDIDQTGSKALQQIATGAKAGTSELQRLIRAGQGTANQYEKLLQKGKARQGQYSALSREGRQSANTIAAATKLLNEELERQNTLIKLATIRLREFGGQAQVLRNVRQSAFSRAESGFAAFSQSASRVNNQNAIDKSIRRQREKIAKAFRDMPAMQAPLMLPSSEMLQASERGIQRLSSYYGDLNTQIDQGLNKGREFTEQLSRQAATGQQLPPIFGQVEKALNATVKGASAGNRITQSWNTVLREGLQTDVKRANAAANIARLYDGTLDITNAQIVAQKNLAEIEKKRAAQAKKDNADRAKRLESIALGVGFPLLFGAGGGSVLGSLAGSFAGQGFGGQILGGAVGQVFDDFATRTAELGRALNPLTADIDLIIERVGLVGTETATYIKALEEADQSTAALAAATKELEAIIGKNGVIALQGFGDQTQEFANEWQIAMTQMGAALSALLSGPLGAVISNLERANALRSAQSSNDPVLQDLLRQRNEAGRPGIFGGGFGNVKSQLEINDQIVQRTRELANERANAAKEIEKSNELDLASLNLLEAQIALEKVNGDLTSAAVFALEEKVIRRQAEVDLQAAGNDQTKIETAQLKEQLSLIRLRNRAEAAKDKAAEAAARTAASAAKAAEAEQKRIAILQAELNTSTALLAIDKQIAAAQVNEDKAKLAELEFTRALEASELKIAEIRARGAGEAETQLQIQLEELRLEDELLGIDTKRALERKKLQESFQATIDGLTIELGLAQAVTREEENRLKLEQKRLSLQGKGLNENEVNQILELEGRLQAAQAPIQQYMTQLQKSLNDVDAQIVRMAQTIETELGSAMSSAITGVITGTQTVEQAMATMFENIGKAFIDMATQMIAKALILKVLGVLGGGSNMGGSNMGGSGYYDPMTGAGTAGPNFGLADGGSVNPNGIHLVGEQGPELFVPGQAGMVVPNDIFEATRQALTSGGGTAQAFEENSDALATSNSYIRERVMERDRQMMLTGAGGSTTVQTQVINSVEYATIDQVQQVADLSAKKARAQVFADMRNKPSTRASLGMG